MAAPPPGRSRVSPSVQTDALNLQVRTPRACNRASLLPLIPLQPQEFQDTERPPSDELNVAHPPPPPLITPKLDLTPSPPPTPATPQFRPTHPGELSPDACALLCDSGFSRRLHQQLLLRSPSTAAACVLVPNSWLPAAAAWQPPPLIIAHSRCPPPHRTKYSLACMDLVSLHVELLPCPYCCLHF